MNKKLLLDIINDLKYLPGGRIFTLNYLLDRTHPFTDNDIRVKIWSTFQNHNISSYTDKEKTLLTVLNLLIKCEILFIDKRYGQVYELINPMFDSSAFKYCLKLLKNK